MKRLIMDLIEDSYLKFLVILYGKNEIPLDQVQEMRKAFQGGNVEMFYLLRLAHKELDTTRFKNLLDDIEKEFNNHYIPQNETIQ